MSRLPLDPVWLDQHALFHDYAALIRHWERQGWTPATSSNFSLRLGEAPGFWVSRSGVDKSLFSAADFIPVSAEGQPGRTGDIPSAETCLHATVYNQLSGIRLVAHTHTVNLTVLSRRLESAGRWQLSGYEMQKAFTGISTHADTLRIPIFGNSQQMGDIAGPLNDWLQTNPAVPGFLIAGHGLYAWADSLPTLKRHVEAFEFLAACDLLLHRV